MADSVFLLYKLLPYTLLYLVASGCTVTVRMLIILSVSPFFENIKISLLINVLSRIILQKEINHQLIHKTVQLKATACILRLYAGTLLFQ